MQRAILALCLFLAIALPTHAGGKAKPNTLTPQEIADGWLLLFDGESTFGWKLDPSGNSQMKVADGVLSLNPAEADLQFTTSFVNFELRVEYKCKSAGMGIFGAGRKVRQAFGIQYF